MRGGNARIGKPADSGGDARHDAKWNTMFNERERFFSTPPKHKRIATFQAQHLLALFCKFDKPQGYIALFRRRLAAAFASIFQNSTGIPERKAGIIDQRVIDYDIRLLQNVDSMKCQKARITRTCPHKPDV